MKITRFEDLECWQEARKLVRMVYALTRKPKFSKDYRLSSQIQSASVSSMSNIAEGFDRWTYKDRIRFLDIAFSSATEVQSLLYVALDQAYVNKDEFQETYNQASTTKELVAGFRRHLKKDIKRRN